MDIKKKMSLDRLGPAVIPSLVRLWQDNYEFEVKTEKREFEHLQIHRK